MNTPILSICIPTFNRAEYLRGLLENIKNEVDDRIDSLIEIVIVDGCSADHTKQVINIYENELNIRSYYRNQREGVDKDILKSVELALGKYCWLFSDDDRFAKNALHYVVASLNKNQEIKGLFCNRVSYDKELNKRVNEIRKWPCTRAAGEEYLASKSECFKRIGMDFGYISSQIINREAWNAVVRRYDPSRLNGSMYMMVDIIASMMNSEFTWAIINRPLVMQRTGNDSILAGKGIVRRQQIEHNGFSAIINLHFERHNKEYRVFNNKMIGRLPRVIANIKSQKIEYSKQLEIFRLHIKKYHQYPVYWIKTLPIMLMPNALFTLVKRLYFRYWIK
jgi:abequosyltransferase